MKRNLGNIKMIDNIKSMNYNAPGMPGGGNCGAAGSSLDDYKLDQIW
jgi:hypothetical protein